MRHRSAAVLLCLLALPVAAQPVVEGTVLTPDGQPAAGILVSASSGRVGPEPADSVRTDADGGFRLVLDGAYTYSFSLDFDATDLWLPLMLDGLEGPVRLDVRANVDGANRRQALDGFQVTSAPALVGQVMTAFTDAERWYRTPVTSDELERMETEFPRLVETAPVERQDAVRDSLMAVGERLYAQALEPRLAATLGDPAVDTAVMRQARALWGFDKVHKDSARAVALLRDVPPDSPLWSYETASSTGFSNPVGYATEALGPAWTDEVEAYVRRAARHPDPNVREQAGVRLYRMLKGRDPDAALAVADQLAREFPDSRYVESIRREQGEDRRVRPGQPAPAFSFPALDAGPPITNASSGGADLPGGLLGHVVRAVRGRAAAPAQALRHVPGARIRDLERRDQRHG